MNAAWAYLLGVATTPVLVVVVGGLVGHWVQREAGDTYAPEDNK